ncbi:hypothetical protein KBD87_00765 [Candidatus Saccharibacteria bacterium]|nr:hypothetical protein [Candidatus Saccharibacteria bacterium]
MADEPNNQQSISDDQELAKVLAGVSQQTDDDNVGEPSSAVVPTPVIPGAILPTSLAADEPTLESRTESLAPVSLPEPEAMAPESSMPPMPEITPQPEQTLRPSYSEPASGSELDTIKKEALGELRPLVDKLDVSAEEKFDTYLLLLRSTDDKELIAPAHEAAKAIEDETRRAQALLDIIKEIDFLSQNQ